MAGYNDAVKDFNAQLTKKAGTAQPKFASKATKAYSAQPLESAGYTNVRGTNNADEKNGNPVLKTGVMPKASDYPGDFEAYKKAKAAWNAKQKAKGGK